VVDATLLENLVLPRPKLWPERKDVFVGCSESEWRDGGEHNFVNSRMRVGKTFIHVCIESNGGLSFGNIWVMFTSGN